MTATNGPRTRRTVPLGALVLAVLVALALAILAVVALLDDDGAQREDGLREAAGRFTERFLTFDHDGLDRWRDEVEALATADFSDEVEEVGQQLRDLIRESELDARASVNELFVGDVERGGARVVVSYDRTVSTTDGERTERDRYLQLSMLSVDGTWLVDDVVDLAAAGPAPVDPSSTGDPGGAGGTGDAGSTATEPDGAPGG